MKVIMINGSPRVNGNTALALAEMESVFRANGIQTETIQVGYMNMRGCLACDYCRECNRCVFDDAVNDVAPKFEKADGLVIASPVYYASANGTLISFLDRLFYSTTFDRSMKVGASIAVARRSGATATFDELNKYFAISNMPIATSQYWNNVHGHLKGDAVQDLEGLQTMRVLAENMTFLMKSIALGKEQIGMPVKEDKIVTNFIPSTEHAEVEI